MGDRHGLILGDGRRHAGDPPPRRADGLLSNSVGENAVYDRALMGELLHGDDLPGNFKPARELGMATVLHRARSLPRSTRF